MSGQTSFQPGSLVSARGRDWIVLPQSFADTLYLRPLGATEDDATLIYLPIEPHPVGPATFPWPRVEQASNFAAGQLLRDALQLKLRTGAGPFRSFGNIAVEPRAYQLVPLLMALKQDVVRLLVADDVGIGKTIEAALIVRELLDRGEVSRLAVLCPPHLCEQWQRELKERFHINAVVVRNTTAGRLERGLPANQSVFEAYPFTVVSLDYIKSDRRRDEFQRACPECVIVDEAHTCTYSGQGRQQRYTLLKGLAENPERHMVLLTATPHSGDEEAFYNLLGLLKPEFRELKDLPPDSRRPLREQLANHFVQRRRPDIEEWQDRQVFPERLTTEITYKLTGEWGKLFDDVLDYARELVMRTEDQSLMQQRMSWWAALALLRCISSSPQAAVNALRTRLQGQALAEQDEIAEAVTLEEADEQGMERVLDGTEDDLTTQDIEPAANTEDSTLLKALVTRAEGLAGAAKDPKLKRLIDHLKELTDDGFQPVVFCRYIATAHYVAEQLRRVFSDHQVTAVTGEFAPAEREAAVEAMGEAEQRILVATDCLSEGINLQNLFTAVVHYDLSWNPTRHEQREGRVDRFGQKAREVRTTLLYGQDNPVDGAVLQVILRKAESIRKELGVLVPMPDDQGKLTQALVGAVLLRKGTSKAKIPQLGLDFGAPEEAIDTAWQSARDKAAKNRTLFAQRRLKPEDVLPEWQKTMAVLGGESDVERFVKRATMQLGAPLEHSTKSGATHWKLHANSLPSVVGERLEGEGLAGTLHIDFHQPPAPAAQFIHRTHPLVSVLADYLLEAALDEGRGAAELVAEAVARAGAIFTEAVSSRTTVLLVRLRHQLTVTIRGNSSLLLCEETLAVGVPAGDESTLLDDDVARALMAAVPSRNMPPPLRDQHIQRALDQLPGWQSMLEAVARTRAQLLLEDHRRVRAASDARGEYRVTPSLPIDVVGVFVLIPA
ncbi:helicase-related protein [Cupriavidus taiwanensis]|uniref:helicase-related protein n=1 Tax=Cupriavidus taiwanensis TaxID=164546 RepID=UPI000E1057A7|nr:helicase-related protein [Cupriavidus taiwanensis]SOY48521.1 Helicase domain protein [Cupriavidus taiwanensis]SOY83052.1 Helicase domain protein [Cupriavidus taiwanensis]SOZ56243.1 Helicase domain protein [Cupriavidus taiwanensis]SOZ78821.1 Helicase domain protein [Cupriavidus taiwanensis]SOZ79098.1 Helicase domain protein [Cupriavidus taiwanensis]